MEQNFIIYQPDMDTYKEMGIKFLTGEACALGMRMLCELDEYAMSLYLEYTGIAVRLEDLPKRSVNDSSRWAVYLTRHTMFDLLIMHLMNSNEMVKAVKYAYSDFVWTSTYLYAGNREDIEKHIFEHKKLYGYVSDEGKWVPGEIYEVERTYCFYNTQPRRGFGNVHAFGGFSH